MFPRIRFLTRSVGKELVPIVKVRGGHPLSNVGMRVIDYRAWDRDYPKLAASGHFTATNAINLDSTFTDIGNIPRSGEIFLSSRPLGIDLSTSSVVSHI